MDSENKFDLKDLRDHTSITGFISASIILVSIHLFSSSSSFIDISQIIYFSYITYLSLIVSANHLIKREYNHDKKITNYLYPSSAHWKIEPLAFGVMYLFIILLFANLYYHLSISNTVHFGLIDGITPHPKLTPNSWVDAFYFSIITITTLGYGDISPTTNSAKILCSAQSLFGVLVMGLFLYSLSERKDKKKELENFASKLRSEHFPLLRISNVIIYPSIRSICELFKQNPQKYIGDFPGINPKDHELIEKLESLIFDNGMDILIEKYDQTELEKALIDFRKETFIRIELSNVYDSLAHKLNDLAAVLWSDYKSSLPKIMSSSDRLIDSLTDKEKGIESTEFTHELPRFLTHVKSLVHSSEKLIYTLNDSYEYIEYFEKS